MVPVPQHVDLHAEPSLERSQHARRVERAKSARRDAGRARGESIKAAILDDTLEELAQSGLDNLSVERIAASAEVNKTSVYRRWPSREQLIGAAFERVLVDLSAKLRDTGSLQGDLRALAEAVAQFLGTPAGRAVAAATLSSSPTLRGARSVTTALLDQSRRAAEALVMRAMARGEWRPMLHPEVVLTALVGGVIHRVVLERLDPGAEWLDSLVDVLVRGARP